MTTIAQAPAATQHGGTPSGATGVRETVADRPPGASTSSPQSQRRWLSSAPSDQALIGCLILLALICYSNSLFNGFVYDDEQQILQNAYVKSWHYLPQIFGSTVWSFVGAAGTTNYYRPLMTFTFLILWQLFGDIPFGFHLFNITLNAAVVVMVFTVGRRLFQDRRIAWIAAVLFAIHPVHSEVVDWIAAVPELEVTFFVLLTFWPFMRLGRASWKIYIATVAAYTLALLSKEPALMFAPLAIAFGYFVRPATEPKGTAGKITRCIPICAVAAAYLLLRIALFGKLAPVLQHPKITWTQAIYSALALIAGYTKYLFWPAPLSAFHAFHPSTSLRELPVVMGALVVLIAGAFIFYFYKRSPAVAFCIFWVSVTIAPMLNARWMASNVFAERYLYLPSVGFCWLVAWCGLRIWDGSSASAPRMRRVLPAAGALIFFAALVDIVLRNRIWGDDMTLYTRTLQTNPDAAVIRSNLGALYFNVNQFDRALEEWQRALADKPDNIVTMNALGILYTRLGRYPEATAILTEAIDAKPLWGDSHFNYALLLQKEKRLPEALQEFKTAVTLSPLSGAAHRWYGEALVLNSQFDEAAIQFQQAVELENSLDAMHDLAELYSLQGHEALAEPLLRRMIIQFPFDSSAHLLLAKVLEDAAKRDEALHEYQQVLATDSANTQAKAAVQRLQR